MNDATYKCEEKDRERLKKENNAILEGFTVKARYRIMPGCEIKLSYDGKWNGCCLKLFYIKCFDVIFKTVPLTNLSIGKYMKD